jgi:hypothetical protein
VGFETGKELFINPYIGFLVSGMQAIREMIAAGQYSSALEYTRQYLIYLDPKIKKELHEERETLDRMITGNVGFTKEAFYEVLDKLLDALHDAKYFELAKFAQPKAKTPGHLK